MVPPYGYISRKIDVLQPYSHSVLTSVSCALMDAVVCPAVKVTLELFQPESSPTVAPPELLGFVWYAARFA